MTLKLKRLGRTFPQLGRFRRQRQPESSRSRNAYLGVRKSVNYERIKEQVNQAIAQLGEEWRRLIPASGTLPERLCGLVLAWLGYTFQAQISEDGGRLRVGGAIVDFKVWVGTTIIVVRVQGDYWHSLPDRKHKDQVQWERLHSRGYRVCDFWEHDLYEAWAQGNIRSFVREGVLNAS